MTFNLKTTVASRPFAVGVWTLSVVAAVVLAAEPVSGLWRLYQHDRSPAARRSTATVMSARAGHAFTDARTAIGVLVSFKPLQDKRAAVDALKTAQRDFSRDMARAADASDGRRKEILALRSKGEALIRSECAHWTQVDNASSSRDLAKVAGAPAAMMAATRSQLLYFKTCLTDTSRFQQTLDDQTSALVADMTAAALK